MFGYQAVAVLDAHMRLLNDVQNKINVHAGDRGGPLF
jgi:hypothetical protein